MGDKDKAGKYVTVGDIAAYLGMNEKAIRMRGHALGIEKHKISVMRGHKICQVNAITAEEARRIIDFYKKANENIISVEDLMKDGN